MNNLFIFSGFSSKNLQDLFFSQTTTRCLAARVVMFPGPHPAPSVLPPAARDPSPTGQPPGREDDNDSAKSDEREQERDRAKNIDTNNKKATGLLNEMRASYRDKKKTRSDKAAGAGAFISFLFSTFTISVIWYGGFMSLSYMVMGALFALAGIGTFTSLSGGITTENVHRGSGYIIMTTFALLVAMFQAQFDGTSSMIASWAFCLGALLICSCNFVLGK